MNGEKNLNKLLKSMEPQLQEGEYVFCTVSSIDSIDMGEIIMYLKEVESHTLILKKQVADRHQLVYSFVASWITLMVHSALDAVGLTAAFSNALTKANISCNVVAGYYHDHIFVDSKDADRAMKALIELSNS